MYFFFKCTGCGTRVASCSLSWLFWICFSCLFPPKNVDFIFSWFETDTTIREYTGWDSSIVNPQCSERRVTVELPYPVAYLYSCMFNLNWNQNRITYLAIMIWEFARIFESSLEPQLRSDARCAKRVFIV